jgi:Fungal Zn(2)-Cys(6) binuclear cluster domain
MSAEQAPTRPVRTERLEGHSRPPRIQNHTISTSSPQPLPAPNSSRRLKACISCRGSKLRCKRNEERPEDSCDRCISAGRQCIIPAPARKRRPRRNISTVASLESKVDALVAALKQKQAGHAEGNGGESPLDSLSGESSTSFWRDKRAMAELRD